MGNVEQLLTDLIQHVETLEREVVELKNRKLERAFEWHSTDVIGQHGDTVSQKWVLWDRTTHVVFWDVRKLYSESHVDSIILNRMLKTPPAKPPLARYKIMGFALN